MSTLLRDRLLSAETEFFAALVDGDDAVAVFNKGWEALLDDINNPFESLDPDTLTLAHTTALRIATLADTSIELYTSYDSYTSQLVSQLDSMMSELAFMDTRHGAFIRDDLGSSVDGPPHTVLPSSRKRQRDPDGTSPRSKRRKSEPVQERSSDNESPKKPFPLVIPLSTNATCRPIEAPPIETVTDRQVVAPYISRKRRRSETEASLPLPPSKLHVGPRLHAASDSYAISHRNHEVPRLRAPFFCTEALGLAQLPVIKLDPSLPLDVSPLAAMADVVPALQSAYSDNLLPVSTANTLASLDGLDDLLRSFYNPSEPLSPDAFDAYGPRTQLDSPLTSSASTPSYPPTPPSNDAGVLVSDEYPVIQGNSGPLLTGFLLDDPRAYLGMDSDDVGLHPEEVGGTCLDWNVLFDFAGPNSWSIKASHPFVESPSEPTDYLCEADLLSSPFFGQLCDGPVTESSPLTTAKSPGVVVTAKHEELAVMQAHISSITT